MAFIAVVDYGAGNLMSVTNALGFLGIDKKIVSDPGDLEAASGVILPGVGAFPAAMDCLNQSGFTGPVRAAARRKPLLGICLGMQMLFGVGREFSDREGLGLIPGEVRRMETDLKLPHIGWNSLRIVNPCPLLEGVGDGAYMYFVHSYCGVPENAENLVASSLYGEELTAVVSDGKAVFGCQFHPEKSGEPGLRILKNFGDLCK